MEKDAWQRVGEAFGSVEDEANEALRALSITKAREITGDQAKPKELERTLSSVEQTRALLAKRTRASRTDYGTMQGKALTYALKQAAKRPRPTTPRGWAAWATQDAQIERNALFRADLDRGLGRLADENVTAGQQVGVT